MKCILPCVGCIQRYVYESPERKHYVRSFVWLLYHIIFGFISQGSVNFKFGVLYAKDGQLTDDEMFSNGEFFIFFLIVLFIQIKKV